MLDVSRGTDDRRSLLPERGTDLLGDEIVVFHDEHQVPGQLVLCRNDRVRFGHGGPPGISFDHIVASERNVDHAARAVGLERQSRGAAQFVRHGTLDMGSAIPRIINVC